MTKYGEKELAYSEAFADALVKDDRFRAWVLQKTKFAEHALDTVVLADEMMALRGATAQNWWRSHYSERCRCEGCRGQETDILAVFETVRKNRFALHIEVKQPDDKFPTNKDQGAGYALRAACWTRNAPAAVLPHEDAATVLLCSAFKLKEYAPQPAKFDTVITFETLRLNFPKTTPRL